MLTEKASQVVKRGYLSKEEATFLQDKLEDIPKGTISVNIGAGFGTSSISVLEKRPDLTKTFYTIDIRNHPNPFGGLLNERNAFTNAELSFPNQIHGDSKEVAKTWANGKVGLLIIDGDHTREGARGDITLWEKHLTDGAVVFVHDYESINWSEVTLAVQDLMINNPDYTLIDQVDSYIAFVYTKK